MSDSSEGGTSERDKRTDDAVSDSSEGGTSERDKRTDDAVSDGISVRVLSYNVRSLRDDAAKVAAVISELRPDVACLQEAPRFLRWRSRCAQLARESGLHMVTGGRTAGAVLLLSSLRADVVRAEDVLLPKHAHLHQRGVALAVLAIGGVRFAVATTHLSLDAGERAEQAGLVAGLLTGLDEPAVVLAGDLNDRPGAPAWAAFTGAGLRDAHAVSPWGGTPTFPAVAPDRRIDAIFASAVITVRRCGVPPGLVDPAAASDHLPVVADLVLTKR